MVRMAVGQHHAIQMADAALLQPRQHRQLANAPAVTDLAARVHQGPRAVVTLQQRGIAVADVQPRDPRATRGHALVRLLPHRAQQHQRHGPRGAPPAVTSAAPVPKQRCQHGQRNHQTGQRGAMPLR